MPVQVQHPSVTPSAAGQQLTQGRPAPDLRRTRHSRCPHVRCGAFRANVDSAYKVIQTYQSTIHPSVQVLEVPATADVELAGHRLLVLSEAQSPHSIWHHEQEKMCQFYWGNMVAFPLYCPPGPIAILGLGAGTMAQLIHTFFPSVHMVGWELDPAVVQAGRDHMGLADLEATGALETRVGDAFGPDMQIEGGFAGILVDLYSSDELAEQLQWFETWEDLKTKLAPGGRICCNVGGFASAERAINAMRAAFGSGNVMVRNTATERMTANMLCMSGPFAVPGWTFQSHLGQTPPQLAPYTEGWAPII